MLKPIQAAVAAAALAATIVPATARDILEFFNTNGWRPGQSHSSIYGEGLDVDLTIERSTNNGRMYVVARFCNRGNSDLWVGGIRVTTDEERARKAHATIRVRDGACSRWGEHLEIGSRYIYVHVSRQGG